MKSALQKTKIKQNKNKQNLSLSANTKLAQWIYKALTLAPGAPLPPPPSPGHPAPASCRSHRTTLPTSKCLHARLLCHHIHVWPIRAVNAITPIAARPVFHRIKKREGGRYAFCTCDVFPEWILRENFPPALPCLKTNFAAAATVVNKSSLRFRVEH